MWLIEKENSKKAKVTLTSIHMKRTGMRIHWQEWSYHEVAAIAEDATNRLSATIIHGSVIYTCWVSGTKANPNSLMKTCKCNDIPALNDSFYWKIEKSQLSRWSPNRKLSENVSLPWDPGTEDLCVSIPSQIPISRWDSLTEDCKICWISGPANHITSLRNQPKHDCKQYSGLKTTTRRVRSAISLAFQSWCFIRPLQLWFANETQTSWGIHWEKIAWKSPESMCDQWGQSLTTEGWSKNW